MLIFIDTEFTDFTRPQLISLGAITEDGREFYIEITDYDKQASSDFVKSVVEPMLSPKFGFPSISAGARLWEWLEDLGDVQLILSYIEGDWNLTIDLLGHEIPQNLNPEPELISVALCNQALMAGITLGCRSDRIFTQAYDLYKERYLDYFLTHQVKQHHALTDAKAMKFAYECATQQIHNFKPRLDELILS